MIFENLFDFIWILKEKAFSGFMLKRKWEVKNEIKEERFVTWLAQDVCRQLLIRKNLDFLFYEATWVWALQQPNPFHFFSFAYYYLLVQNTIKLQIIFIFILSKCFLNNMQFLYKCFSKCRVVTYMLLRMNLFFSRSFNLHL